MAYYMDFIMSGAKMQSTAIILNRNGQEQIIKSINKVTEHGEKANLLALALCWPDHLFLLSSASVRQSRRGKDSVLLAL